MRSRIGGIFCLLLLQFFLSATLGSTIQQDLGSHSVQWKFHSQNKSVSGDAQVPGGIFTDLKNANILKEDFFFRDNDIRYRWVSWDNWTYYATFKASKEMQKKEQINLIFDGLNTVANVTLNGHQLCACKNLFTKFVFPVSKLLLLKDGAFNELVVNFQSTPAYAAQQDAINPTAPRTLTADFHGESHVNMVRTMQASFGWDWGPALPSQGIWKNVSLEGYDSATIRDVTYHISLIEKHTWNVTVIAFVEKASISSDDFSLELTLVANEATNFKTVHDVHLKTSGDNNGQIAATLEITYDGVSLWWPNGINQSQPLYNITVRLLSKNSELLSEKTNKIGFRTLRVVQDFVNPDLPDNGRYFYFEVNGAPIFAKGSNFIPAHTMPELGTNPQVAEHLLRSSAEANHNMLRVWGGGVYETDFFYQMCDELGIMVWQDFMFANGHYPADEAFNNEVRNEVTQTVRRLQHHPCIALWAGNNENEGAVAESWWGKGELVKENYRRLYGHVIRDIVVREDPLRPYVPSSPTNGILTEQDGFLPVKISAWSEIYGDTHFYSYGSASILDSRTYRVARFVSEYGFQSMPFLRVWKKDTVEVDLIGGLDSNFVKHRQHQPGGNGRLFSQTANVLIPGEREKEFKNSSFNDFIFITQVAQAIATRVEAEKHRRNRNSYDEITGEGYTMGSMYWQLNDIWAAPSWGGIDCEGTWKMLHYHMAELFAPVAISTDLNRRMLIPENLQIYAMNDYLHDLNDLQIEAKLFDWQSLEPMVVKQVIVDKLAHSSAEAIYEGGLEEFFGIGNFSYEKSFTTFQLQEKSGKPLTGLQILPLQNYKIVDFSKSPNLKVVSVTKSDKKDIPLRYLSVYDVTIATEKPAAFVWLDVGEIRGRFSDNGFIFAQAERTVQFLALQDLSADELKKALTIQSLNDALKPYSQKL